MSESQVVRRIYVCPWDEDSVISSSSANHKEPASGITHIIISSCGKCIKDRGFNYESEARVRARELPNVEYILSRNVTYRLLIDNSKESKACKVLCFHEVCCINGHSSLPYRY